MIEVWRPLALAAIPALILVTMALCAPAAVAAIRLIRRLKQDHPKLWADLDRPGGLFLSREQNSKFTAFVRSDDARMLGDTDVDRWIKQLRILRWLLNLFFWGAFGLILFCAFTAPGRT